MKEIVIKRNGRQIVKIKYDEDIIKEFEDNPDLLEDGNISYQIIGCEINLPFNSILCKITRGGKQFKVDKHGKNVFWYKIRVLGTSHNEYEIGMDIWVKFQVALLNAHDIDSMDDVHKFVGKKAIFTNVLKPFSNSEDVFFLFKYNSFNIVN